MRKPAGKNYFSHTLSRKDYNERARTYAAAKRTVICNVYAWATGVGIGTIIKAYIKGEIKSHVREYAWNTCTLILESTAIFLIVPVGISSFCTKAKWLVSKAQKVYSIGLAVYEYMEDSTSLLFAPLDVALFGQPIPVREKSHFDFLIGDFVN